MIGDRRQNTGGEERKGSCLLSPVSCLLGSGVGGLILTGSGLCFIFHPPLEE